MTNESLLGVRAAVANAVKALHVFGQAAAPADVEKALDNFSAVFCVLTTLYDAEAVSAARALALIRLGLVNGAQFDDRQTIDLMLAIVDELLPAAPMAGVRTVAH